MALGDYILCCKCEVKLIYDGDRNQREWWEERFGKPPEIECPDCKTPQRQWVGLTDEEIQECISGLPTQTMQAYAKRIEDKLKEKNGL
jgi:hypothetical protein